MDILTNEAVHDADVGHCLQIADVHLLVPHVDRVDAFPHRQSVIEHLDLVATYMGTIITPHNIAAVELCCC